jgi:Outer membrane protein beta-barrel domain
MTTYIKASLLSFFLIASSINLFAQGFTVHLKSGFAWGQGFSDYGIYNPKANNPTNIKEVIGKLALGEGLSYGGGLGYMFNKNVGVELDITYLSGSISYNTTSVDNSVSHEGRSYESYAEMLRVVPSFVINSGNEKLNIYGKFGLLLGLGSMSTQNSINSFNNMTNKSFNSFNQYKVNGGMAIGMSTSLGIEIKLLTKVSFFSDVNVINLSYTPTKQELITATEKGVNVLPSKTISEKQTVFQNSISYNSKISQNKDLPSEVLSWKLPFNSIGLNVGLKLKF